MELIDFLKTKYKFCEELANGGYFFYNSEKGNSDGLYIPKDYKTTEEMGYLSYLPGIGGSANDAAQLRNQIRSTNNPPQYIISISGDCKDKNDTVINNYEYVTNNSDIKIKNMVLMSFSASGVTGYDKLENFMSKHEDVKCSMVVNNSGYDSGRVDSPNKYPHLVQNKVPIIYVYPTNQSSPKSKMSKGSKNGFNVYWLQSTSSGHVAFNADIIYNRFVDVLLGYSNSFGSKSTKGKNISYTLVKYDYQAGKYLEADYSELTPTGGKVTIEDVEAPQVTESTSTQSTGATDTGSTSSSSSSSSSHSSSSSSSSSHSSSSSSSSSSKSSSSSSSKKSSSKEEKKEETKSDTDASKKVEDSVVTSDYEYVSESMNAFCAAIKESDCIKNLSIPSLNGADPLMAKITECINSYYDAVNLLLNNMYKEAEAVVSYAQAMVDLDKDIQNDVKDLGSIKELELDTESRPAGRRSDDPASVYGNNATPPATSEEGSYSFSYSANNGEITEVEVSYTYSSSEEARNHLQEVKDKYKYDVNVETVYVNGDKVQVKFKDVALKTLTEDELEQKYKGAE